MTYNPSNESDSSGNEGGLILRERRERLNIPKGPIVGITREQIETDREFIKKLLKEVRLRGPSPMEILGDVEYAQRL